MQPHTRRQFNTNGESVDDRWSFTCSKVREGRQLQPESTAGAPEPTIHALPAPSTPSPELQDTTGTAVINYNHEGLQGGITLPNPFLAGGEDHNFHSNVIAQGMGTALLDGYPGVRSEEGNNAIRISNLKISLSNITQPSKFGNDRRSACLRFPTNQRLTRNQSSHSI
jgi:hypothetical protein